VQTIIDVVVALTAIYAAAMSTINQLQIRRQMQRKLSVRIKQTIMDLPRIPDRAGGRAGTPVHVFMIQAVNPGLTSVVVKGARLLLPDGTLLDKGIAPKEANRWFPFELAPGDDQVLLVDAYEVLEAMKGSHPSGKVAVQGLIITPLQRFKSNKLRLNAGRLSGEIQRVEGKWRASEVWGRWRISGEE
jgi:hypothetical protein